MVPTSQTFCGHFAFIGRPNVGKSTLLNALMGKKISITSRKAQTTQKQIIGFQTYGQYQLCYWDLPGINLESSLRNTSASKFNQVSIGASTQADFLIFMSAGTHWLENDRKILKQLVDQNRLPDFWLINKMDQVRPKSKLLSHIARITQQHPFETVYPLSAYDADGIHDLIELFRRRLPPAPFYSETLLGTNLSEKETIVELIREPIYRYLQKEVPYQTDIQLEKLENELNGLKVIASITVKTAGQQNILRQITAQPHHPIIRKAEKNIAQAFNYPAVTLSLWTKLRKRSHQPRLFDLPTKHINDRTLNQ